MTRHGWIAFGVAGLYLAGARLPAWTGDPDLVRVLLAMPVGLLVGLVAGRGARCLWAVAGLCVLNMALGGFAAEAVVQSLASMLAALVSISTSRHLAYLLDSGAWLARMRVVLGFALSALSGALALTAGLWYLCPDFCEPDLFLLQQLAVHGWSLALGVPLVLALLSRVALQRP